MTKSFAGIFCTLTASQTVNDEEKGRKKSFEQSQSESIREKKKKEENNIIFYYVVERHKLVSFIFPYEMKIFSCLQCAHKKKKKKERKYTSDVKRGEWSKGWERRKSE